MVSSTDPVVTSNAVIKAAVYLVVLGLLLASVRIVYMNDKGHLPAGDSAWKVSLAVHASALEKGQEIHVSPVINTRFARLYSQSIHHPGMAQKRVKKKPESRDIVLSALRPGITEVGVVFEIHLRAIPVDSTVSTNDADRSMWLQQSEGVFLDSTFTRTVLESANRSSLNVADRALYLYELVSERVRTDPAGSSDARSVWDSERGSQLGIARLIISLLRSEHIPARLVTGIEIGRTGDSILTHWAEVYYSGAWHSVDPARGFLGDLPRELVPFVRDYASIVRGAQGEHIPFTVKVENEMIPAGMRNHGQRSVLEVVDFMRISPQGREALALLILLPIGVLVTELLRQGIGIRTFGTFTPTLLGLALVYVDARTAIIVFVLVGMLGIGGRSMLKSFALNRGARLGLVFTMVAASMAFVVSLLLYFDPSVDTSVVLLPVVVLTTLIDRFYSVADDPGFHHAVKRLGWTIVAAAFSLLILLQRQWGHWLLNYPELHFVTVGVILLTSQYRWRKLSQVRGFEWISEPTGRVRRSGKNQEE